MRKMLAFAFILELCHFRLQEKARLTCLGVSYEQHVARRSFRPHIRTDFIQRLRWSFVLTPSDTPSLRIESSRSLLLSNIAKLNYILAVPIINCLPITCSRHAARLLRSYDFIDWAILTMGPAAYNVVLIFSIAYSKTFPSTRCNRNRHQTPVDIHRYVSVFFPSARYLSFRSCLYRAYMDGTNGYFECQIVPVRVRKLWYTRESLFHFISSSSLLYIQRPMRL